MSTATKPTANNLDAFFMPFTANRQFKKNPRLLAKAKGVHYWTPEGRKIIDGTAGLWCVNAGHGREEIKAAIAAQLEEMDYAPSFQMGHPKSFELAARHAAMLPGDLNHAFYCNSGSEAVDSALKIALAYQRARGQGTRTRLIGRERGYHGVGFGGISVGGMVNNRKWFGPLLNGVDHLPHTHLAKNAFSRGLPEQGGVELADELERIVTLHDASTIAAVIVEPCAGSTGYLPPPKGYLQRLRQICDKHGILLIFDEVITGFGRLGHAFAAERYGVVPDMITFAKGVTSGSAPMGGFAEMYAAQNGTPCSRPFGHHVAWPMSAGIASRPAASAGARVCDSACEVCIMPPARARSAGATNRPYELSNAALWNALAVAYSASRSAATGSVRPCSRDSVTSAADSSASVALLAIRMPRRSCRSA